MIYTLTFNPSLDYITYVDDFEPGKVNRTSKETIFPGGKGLNVSMVLKNLGMDSVALGFVAGFTGDEIIRCLAERNINSDFIRVDGGMSRINVKIKSAEESEINGIGPEISTGDIDCLFNKLDNIKDGDYLVLAGSIPASLSQSIYSDIMDYLANKDIKIVVDATKDLLVNTLAKKPFLVKPNNHELGEIFGVKLTTKYEVIEYAKKLKNMGARNVLVSMANDGAVLITEDDGVIEALPPKGQVVNSVGAGDSMVAGFLYGYIANDNNFEEAFYMGLFTGSASAFSEGLATKGMVEEMLGMRKKDASMEMENTGAKTPESSVKKEIADDTLKHVSGGLDVNIAVSNYNGGHSEKSIFIR